ncbi:hypothetical protein Landi51_00324 [Colletotrichum acutatum]
MVRCVPHNPAQDDGNIDDCWLHEIQRKISSNTLPLTFMTSIDPFNTRKTDSKEYLYLFVNVRLDHRIVCMKLARQRSSTSKGCHTKSTATTSKLDITNTIVELSVESSPRKRWSSPAFENRSQSPRAIAEDDPTSESMGHRQSSDVDGEGKGAS